MTAKSKNRKLEKLLLENKRRSGLKKISKSNQTLSKLLGCEITHLTNDEEEAIYDAIELNFPLKRWGGIQWDAVADKTRTDSLTSIVSILRSRYELLNDDIYVVWAYRAADTTGFRGNLFKVLNNTEQVVIDDTYVLSVEDGYLIEFHHDDDVGIHIGFLPPDKWAFLKAFLDE